MTRDKKSNGNKGRRPIRFNPYKPWSPLFPFEVPPEAKQSNVLACFQNHLLTVFVKQIESPVPGPNGEVSRMTHLLMVWTDKSRKEEIPYRFKQQVKRELCGEMAEGVELFPADWREQDMIQDHLWVLEPGAVFPWGMVPDDPETAISNMLGGRENLVTREELEVFVVRHQVDGGAEMLEVFESEDECTAMYKENDGEIPESSVAGIEMIGDVPAEGDGVAWSDKAKAKVGNVLAKSRNMSSEVKEEPPQLFYEHYTDEDDILDEEDVWDDDELPPGEEERLAIGMAMEEALENKGDERAARVRAVTEEVIGKAGQNIVSAREAAPKIIVPR
jgi:hypothetical protein